MSLNNIRLSPSLMADLYPNVLVQSSAAAVSAKPPVSFLGKNEKNVLILVNGKEASFLPEKELSFLTTVLSACGLHLSDVAIVNWATVETKSFTALQSQLSPKKVLLLDVEPQEAGLPANEQYALKLHDGFEIVSAPPLSAIEKTKQAKSRFWTALKELFCL